MLDYEDPSHNTIRWLDFDESVKMQKQMEYWSKDDLNRECVYAKINQTNDKILFTDYCNISARALCISLTGKKG